MMTDGMVDRAAEDLTRAAETAAQALNAVAELEDERALVKARCIKAMIGQPNPLSEGKAHSASSAEKVVEEHPDYIRHRNLQRDAEVQKWRALGRYEAAKARLWTAVHETKLDRERGMGVVA